MVTPADVEVDDENRYHDALDAIVEGFRYEVCDECGGDLDRHAIIPGPLGLPFARCLNVSDVDR